MTDYCCYSGNSNQVDVGDDDSNVGDNNDCDIIVDDKGKVQKKVKKTNKC